MGAVVLDLLASGCGGVESVAGILEGHHVAIARA
jgi:hypothetical protein